jgi:hypothetical protein
MTKLDITNVPRELDELMETSSSPRQRRILEVVRHHYLLELTARYEEILAPDMMVENPVYYVNVDGASRTLRGRDEVLSFYEEQEGIVLACEETTHAVTDSSYWVECWFNFHVPATALGLEPDGWYLKRHWITMHWPFDERCRVIGEHIYEHTDLSRLVPIDTADVITFEEARKILDPLIRPLPAYPGG